VWSVWKRRFSIRYPRSEECAVRAFHFYLISISLSNGRMVEILQPKISRPQGKRSRRKKNGMHLKRCYNTIWALCGISFGAINQSIPRIFFQPLEHKAGHFSKHFSV
jgi:hypothetical protein